MVALLILPFQLTICPEGNAQDATVLPKAKPAEVVQQIVDATKEFLKTIDDQQSPKLFYNFTDIKQRERWSNLPVGGFPRNGLRVGDLTEKQYNALFKILAATLSKNGYQQVIDNMNGDEYLKKNGGRRDFGKDEYFFAIFGQPSTTKPWMWQFGGHHLAINATIVGERVTLSPSLTGGQPMDYRWEGKAVRQLAEEEDKAYELIAALTPEQLKSVVKGKRYVDLNFGPTARKLTPAKVGIQVSELNEAQQTLVRQLIQSRIGILNQVHADVALKKILADLPETWFSWYGPVEPGKPATYRLEGPSLLMEFSPQRLGGDATNHVHAMYRDPSNDYGVGFISDLRERKK